MTKNNVGIRQQLVSAKSITELENIMAGTTSYSEASAKTRRAWKTTYKRAAAKLAINPEPKAAK